MGLARVEHGVKGFAQLNQLFDEANGVLREHIVVFQAVQHEDGVLDVVHHVYGTAAIVIFCIAIRVPQSWIGVARMVGAPVCYGAECCAAGELVGVAGQAHQGEKAAVRAPIHADTFRIDKPKLLKMLDARDNVVGVFAAHVAVNISTKVMAIACAVPVVRRENHVAFARQAVMKQLVGVVGSP